MASSDTAGKDITCRAAVAWEKGQPLKVETVKVQPPKPDEIRIKMVGTGICYSDVSLINGLSPILEFPTIPGHEGIGVVESVGTNVQNLKPGDAVIPLWAYQCKECRLCKIGRRNYCTTSFGNTRNGKMSDGSNRTSCNGKELTQASGLGLFSEYTVVNKKAALKVPDYKSLENLAPYGCAMPTGYGAALYTAKVFPGAICAVWGLGAVGLSTVLGCRDAGASRIIGINRGKEKRELGKQFGCTDCISPNDYDKPISQVLKEMTDGNGVDFVFVCVGKTDLMEDAYDACCFGGGECIILGIDPDNMKISINHLETLFGKTVKGSFAGDCFTENMSQLVDMYIEGKLPSDAMISQTLPLELINKGFDDLKASKTIRTVIKF